MGPEIKVTRKKFGLDALDAQESTATTTTSSSVEKWPDTPDNVPPLVRFPSNKTLQDGRKEKLPRCPPAVEGDFSTRRRASRFRSSTGLKDSTFFLEPSPFLTNSSWSFAMLRHFLQRCSSGTRFRFVRPL